MVKVKVPTAIVTNLDAFFYATRRCTFTQFGGCVVRVYVHLLTVDILNVFYFILMVVKCVILARNVEHHCAETFRSVPYNIRTL